MGTNLGNRRRFVKRGLAGNRPSELPYRVMPVTLTPEDAMTCPDCDAELTVRPEKLTCRSCGFTETDPAVPSTDPVEDIRLIAVVTILFLVLLAVVYVLEASAQYGVPYVAP